MPCYHPIDARRRGDGSIGFTGDRPGDRESLELACGRCFGCRMRVAQSWSIRCQHEAQLFERKAFVTLTYADGKVPPGGSLRYSDVQLFLKRLRKHRKGFEASPNGKYPIRFFVAGEYGETTSRPHYHVLFYNCDFLDDAVAHGKGTYSSPFLDKTWGLGQCVCGSLTPKSAAYVARYALKKIGGAKSAAHYDQVDTSTGEVISREREFCRMSRRPGIGGWWYDRFASDVLPRDVAVTGKFEARVPRYYFERFRRSDPNGAEAVQEERFVKRKRIPVEQRSAAAREMSEEVAIARLQHFAGTRSF